MKPLYHCMLTLVMSLLLVSCSKADKTSEDGDENPGNETRSPIPYDRLPASSREFTILGPRFYIDLM
ncbi:MAG TPA: hypothetical protein VL943_15205, partial [Niabella sp.]|nr:hypothetical protein [Niabella sp.]